VPYGSVISLFVYTYFIVPVMDYPDEFLPESQMSLKQFVQTAQHLLSLEQSPDALVRVLRFILAGRLELNGSLTRIFINARQGAFPPSIYQSRRDIDSVIGITRDLPFRIALSIFPLPSFRDTLTKNNHMIYKPSSSSGSQVCSILNPLSSRLSLITRTQSAAGIPLHKIPNIALAKADRRQITRVFFPCLYEENESPAISTELRAHIYDQCLRPAAIEVNPLDQSRWPITYEAAMNLYRDDHGQFHFGTIDIPPRFLKNFGTRLLELFQMREEFKDAFFVHELRGTKGATLHDPYDADQRRTALEDVFHAFDTRLFKAEDWVVDIAIEIRCPGHVLQWLTKGHRYVLEFLMPSATARMISDVLNSKTQYHCDLSAQLDDVGGFRSLPGSRGAADNLTYINVYTTDKSATYQLHTGLFKRRKPWHLFPDKIDKLLEDMEKIAGTFRTCGGSQTTDGLEGNARMEIRVPLDLANQTLINIPDDLIQKSLVAFEPPTFW